MKITRAELKQLIKEELEVTLTNEEAGELFGYEVQEELEQQETIEEQAEDLANVRTKIEKVFLIISRGPHQKVLGLLHHNYPFDFLCHHASKNRPWRSVG